MQTLDREVSPSAWPVLVSDRLLAIHRGQREPATITVITLEQENIEKVCIVNKLSLKLFIDIINFNLSLSQFLKICGKS